MVDRGSWTEERRAFREFPLMKQLLVSSRARWRRWLAAHHDRELRGIWLVFHKRGSGKPSLDYEDAVEEALCYGWIDSVVKRINDASYCRKFTPRHDRSNWSPTNRRRAEKVIREGRMTAIGLAKIDAARRLGTWERDVRPAINSHAPSELSRALSRNRKARERFEGLAPSCQRRFIGWIVAAKKPETRARRVRESLALLGRRQQLGLK